jgi:hypothetical protein
MFNCLGDCLLDMLGLPYVKPVERKTWRFSGLTTE